jgi:hypothetical protein
VVTDLRLGRDGDFYGLLSAHTLGEPGFEFQGVSLFRIERSGRVRWRWGGISISLYALDRCGNPCAFSTPFYRIETVMGRSRCPQPPPTRHLYRLTPDGEENLSLASPVEADRAWRPWRWSPWSHGAPRISPRVIASRSAPPGRRS